MNCSMCNKKIKTTVHVVVNKSNNIKENLKLDHVCAKCYKKIKNDNSKKKAA